MKDGRLKNNLGFSLAILRTAPGWQFPPTLNKDWLLKVVKFIDASTI